MIVVVGSRHDPVSNIFLRTWTGATLCSAEDFCAEGWRLRIGRPSETRWVVSGRTVADAEVSGVFIRRHAFFPEEFLSIHPDDRSYLAHEAHAFLVAMAAQTSATVASPVRDGAFGDEALRLDEWMAAARTAGLRVSAPRVTSANRPARRPAFFVDVVPPHAFGEGSAQIGAAAAKAARLADLRWARFLFDDRERLLHVTTAALPSADALAALGALLSRP